MMIGSKLGRHCGRVGIRGRKISCSLLSTMVAAPSTDLAAVSAPASSYNDKYWMPFTDNHKFKGFPRKVFERASGVYYYLEDGTPILDGISGLWCCNAGHGQPKIVQAIQTQAAKLDFAASFNSSHKLPYLFAEKLLELLPGRDFSQVFFTMCGSTAVDTALKIALQYHRANGDHSKVRFIGRERGYHGVGFGGTVIYVFHADVWTCLSPDEGYVCSGLLLCLSVCQGLVSVAYCRIAKPSLETCCLSSTTSYTPTPFHTWPTRRVSRRGATTWPMTWRES